MSKLIIVSHTEHYYDSKGRLVGLNSTVMEINHLSILFDEIVHVATFYNIKAPKNTMGYNEKIRFVPLQPFGGTAISKKLEIVFRAPKVLRIIREELLTATCFHFRAPASIGLYVIPYLGFFSGKKGWFKFAGDWQSETLPVTYRFQRFLLKYQNKPVTINGSWPDQPTHCLSFENPCLTQGELLEGQMTRKNKMINVSQIEICFVGRLEAKKGFDIFSECLLSLKDELIQQISKIHIVGTGPLKSRYKDRLRSLKPDCIFYNNLSREDVHRVYSHCEALILPSSSEGFPKVVIEAMNYGCLPIVTDMASIRKVVTSENGFLIADLSEKKLKEQILNMLNLKPETFRSMIKSSDRLLNEHTYRTYIKKINRILDLLRYKKMNFE